MQLKDYKYSSKSTLLLYFFIKKQCLKKCFEELKQFQENDIFLSYCERIPSPLHQCQLMLANNPLNKLIAMTQVKTQLSSKFC